MVQSRYILIYINIFTFMDIKIVKSIPYYIELLYKLS